MNLEFYIAKKIFKKRNFKDKRTASIITIATLAVAISVAVMIISVSVIVGFKKEITEKVIGFGSHISIVNYDSNTSFETLPISKNQNWLENIEKNPNIVSINKYIQKAGIVKTDENFAGVVFKGIDDDYNWSFFSNHIVEGNILEINDSIRSNNILISKNIADKLGLKLSDNFKSYFIQDPPRMRNFKIVGIYNTNLDDLDKIFVFVDIKQLRKINDWRDDQITGFDIMIDDFSKLTDVEIKLNKLVGNYFSEDGSLLKIRNIKEDYPGIFDWLVLLDMNVWVILVLMLIVSAINMISGILVIILERVKMIGILKSIGAKDVSIEKIFIYFAGFLTTKGLLWGNIIGIGFCLTQNFFGIIKIDPSSYYVDSVPVYFNILYIGLLNIATLIIILLIIILPVLIISKIKPSETIRFD